MKKQPKYSPEVIGRAVRMVSEASSEYESQWAAITSIAAKIGCTPETLRRWVRQQERDTGQRPGPTTAEEERIKALEREVRDPEMHQSKKGKNWFFGMKAHIGVDARSGLTHTLVTTAGNVSDVTHTHKLLHGDETMVFGDAGYQDADKRPENADNAVTWHIAMKRSVRKAMKKHPLGRMKEKLEKAKTSVRAKGEHPLHVLKNLFRHRKTRYRGVTKNTAQLHTLFAFANLVLAGRTFGSARARTPS